MVTYYLEMIFLYNQDDILPDCIKHAHRIANTDFYEILAVEFPERDFEKVHCFLLNQEKERNIIHWHFEYSQQKRR